MNYFDVSKIILIISVFFIHVKKKAGKSLGAGNKD
jgi:hypothetical protein